MVDSREHARLRPQFSKLLVLALSAAAAVGCGGERLAAADPANALRALSSSPPVPIAISPDANRLLFKSAGKTTFKFTVVERFSGRTISEQSFHDSPLAGTFRRDGQAFAYFVDRGGNQQYVPMIMEVGARAPRSLSAPATSVPGPLQWSPDGTRLAYLHASRTTNTRRLVVLGAGRPGIRWQALLSDIAPRTGVAWSSDSRSLAVVQRSSRSAISVVSLDGTVRRYPIARGAEVRELAWTAGNRVLASMRKRGQQYFGIAEVDLGTGRVRDLVNGPWDAVEPQALQGGAFWAFHANIDSEFTPMVCAAGTAVCRRLLLPPGSARILGSVVGTDTLLVSHRGRSTPPAVLSASPGRSHESLPSLLRHARSSPTPQAKRVDLESVGGLRVPVYVWRAPRARRGVRAVVIRVHGGPAVQADRTWDRTTEFLLDEGVDVLQLNYRGSTGYGASFEHASGGDCARVQDLIAAVTYAQRDLGVPRRRIIVYGHSYGALIVAKAGRVLANPIGAVVLVSQTADAEQAACGATANSSRSRMPLRVLAYHGANDYGLSPREARQVIADWYGSGLLDRMRVRWHVFGLEGHTFHRNASWARVYTELIAVIDKAA